MWSMALMWPLTSEHIPRVMRFVHRQTCLCEHTSLGQGLYFESGELRLATPAYVWVSTPWYLTFDIDVVCQVVALLFDRVSRWFTHTPCGCPRFALYLILLDIRNEICILIGLVWLIVLDRVVDRAWKWEHVWVVGSLVVYDSNDWYADNFAWVALRWRLFAIVE